MTNEAAGGATNADMLAVAAVVADYVEGMCRGDGALIARAMHPGAASIGHYGGALEWDGRDAFAAACAGQALPPGVSVPPHVIEWLSIAGDTAVARVTNIYAGERYRDTLSFLKTADGWRIVAKVFQHIG